jgi:hypothetical protein
MGDREPRTGLPAPVDGAGMAHAVTPAGACFALD